MYANRFDLEKYMSAREAENLLHSIIYRKIKKKTISIYIKTKRAEKQYATILHFDILDAIEKFEKIKSERRQVILSKNRGLSAFKSLLADALKDIADDKKKK